MRETLETVFGAWGAVVIQFLVTILVIAGLIALVYWLIQRYSPGGLGRIGRGRVPRLALVDAMPVDGRRRLVLVRRDNVEHLLIIGGPADVVVEAGIQRQRRSKATNGDVDLIYVDDQENDIAETTQPPRTTPSSPPPPVQPAPAPVAPPLAAPQPAPARPSSPPLRPATRTAAATATTTVGATKTDSAPAASNPFQQPPRPASNGIPRAGKPATTMESNFTFRRTNIAPPAESAETQNLRESEASPVPGPTAQTKPSPAPAIQRQAVAPVAAAVAAAGAARVMDFQGPTRIETPADLSEPAEELQSLTSLPPETVDIPEMPEQEEDLPPEDALPAFLTQTPAMDAGAFRPMTGETSAHAPVAMNPFARQPEEEAPDTPSLESETARKVNDLEREMARLLGEIGAKPS